MRATIEREELHGLVRPMFNNSADAVGIDYVDVQGVLDRLGELRERELLQEPQHANERTGAVLLIGSLQPPPQQGKAVRQLPVLQGPGIVESTRLAFEQR